MLLQFHTPLAELLRVKPQLMSTPAARQSQIKHRIMLV